ncbi:hypothetical protein AYO38_07385 [bacterium SCGC AG-212-C10]|nr:hypothetical protein AYO38_07385 [bacterium SCGC AG-212-C10]
MSDRATGNIYDLGYRTYQGQRLGRAWAVWSLYLHSLRTVFGLGRRPVSKIFPVGLAILTILPALIQLGIAAIASGVVDLIKADGYYGYVQVILSLFCAAVAPEIVGRDQRNRALSLYFSRAVTRTDYALAKFFAMTTAMIMLTIGPQLVLFIGNGLAGNDLRGYFQDEWKQFPQIIVSGLFVSTLFASVSLAIASQTPRRAIATGAILGAFYVVWVIVNTLVAGINAGGIFSYAVFISPLHLINGLTLWVFDSRPGAGSAVDLADFPGAFYAIGSIVVTLIATWLILRRFQTVRA